ncbi:MAG: M28 family peptidase [Deltaproteobacteria bacterium]|nr:M28 family peptidase [Deltaproteobacteria bacterium]
MKNKSHHTAFTLVFLAACAMSCCRGGETRKTSAGSDTGVMPKAGASLIDGGQAMGYIKDIIAFGPRHAGTEGAEKTRRYIFEKLKSFGLSPKRHDFTALTPHPKLKKVDLANLSVDFDGPGKRKVLIGGHFDGKILEGVNFKGANDGGSSTALLLEMARVLARTPPPCPVRIVFFDGEEALVKWSDMDSRYGSKRMAAELKQKGEVDSIAAAVIVDMIGDKNLRLVRDTNSTPWVFKVLVRTAERLGYDSLFGSRRISIDDDHIPFLRIGIPAAVLIDFNYGPGWASNSYWHNDKDTVDKLSPKSMEIIGEVVFESLPVLAHGQIQSK